VEDNTISGFEYGYELWALGNTPSTTISGGSVTGAAIGIYATNYDTIYPKTSVPVPAFGAAGSASNAIISDVTVTGATTAGIWVEDGVSGTDLVSLTITDDTDVTGSPTGIL